MYIKFACCLLINVATLQLTRPNANNISPGVKEKSVTRNNPVLPLDCYQNPKGLLESGEIKQRDVDVVVHIYLIVTEQRQTLTIAQSTHFSLQ